MMHSERPHRHLALVAALAVLLLSCAQGEGDGRSLLKGGERGEPSAELSLRVIEKLTDTTFRVGIAVTNPHREPITSVRSWVTFDPSAFAMDDLRIEDERFSLFAPGEWEIAAAEGLVKIGVAAPEPVSDGDLLLASFAVAVSPDERSPLTFYDWRPDGTGHATVFRVGADGDIRPLLLPPISLLLP